MLVLSIALGIVLGSFLLWLIAAACFYRSPRQREFEQRQMQKLVHQMRTSDEMNRQVFGPDELRKYGLM